VRRFAGLLNIRICNKGTHTATHCNTPQRTRTHCNTLQHTYVYIPLLHTRVYLLSTHVRRYVCVCIGNTSIRGISVFQCCSVLQCVLVRCGVLQCVAICVYTRPSKCIHVRRRYIIQVYNSYKQTCTGIFEKHHQNKSTNKHAHVYIYIYCGNASP